MEVKSITVEGNKIFYPAHLPHSDRNFAVWIREVEDYWIQEESIWHEEFLKICNYGATKSEIEHANGVKAPSTSVVRQARWARIRLNELRSAMAFSPEHEIQFHTDREEYNRRAVARSIWIGLLLWIIYGSYLVLVRGTAIVPVGLLTLVILFVMAVMHYVKAGQRKNIRAFSAVGAAVIAFSIWLFPIVLKDFTLANRTITCFVVILFFVAAIADLGRRSILGFCTWLAALTASEMLVIGPASGAPGAPELVFKLIIIGISTAIALFTAFRRSRSRRLVFSLEQRNNAVLAYSHIAVPGCVLGEPDFGAGLEVNSS